MIQLLTLILWAPSTKNENFKVIAERAYSLLSALKQYGKELDPVYETVRKKSDAKPLKGTFEEFEAILRKGVNKEGKTVFIDLGYTVSFFSSLIDEEAAGIKMTVGNTNPKFKNTFIIDLPQNLSIYDPVTAEKLTVLFKNCIQIFEPFWGCISNSLNSDRYDRFWKELTPTAIHWLNYFGTELVERFGKQKIEKAPVEQIDSVGNGYLLQLQKMPIDDTSEEMLLRQTQANKYFGLK